MSSLRMVALLAVVGCAAPLRGAHEREVPVRTFVLGAFGGRSVDVRDLCGGRPARGIRLYRSALDYAASVGTFGIYVPHRLLVVCEEPR